jgi:hypothetical protein
MWFSKIAQCWEMAVRVEKVICIMGYETEGPSS